MWWWTDEVWNIIIRACCSLKLQDDEYVKIIIVRMVSAVDITFKIGTVSECFICTGVFILLCMFFTLFYAFSVHRLNILVWYSVHRKTKSDFAQAARPKVNRKWKPIDLLLMLNTTWEVGPYTIYYSDYYSSLCYSRSILAYLPDLIFEHIKFYCIMHVLKKRNKLTHT